MHTLVNGIQTDTVSTMDRGFLYGDGVFETITIVDGKAVLFLQHLNRLTKACAQLALSFDKKKLVEEFAQLLQQGTGTQVAKIIVTRGVGGRGYKAASEQNSTRVMQLFDPIQEPSLSASKGASVMVCKHRLSQSRTLAGIKHLNRLDQVLASLELTTEFQEGLCLDENDNVIEGTKSNILLWHNNRVVVPDLSLNGVQGIMLAELQNQFNNLGYTIENKALKLSDVISADELILCNSVIGVWPVIKLVEGDTVKHWQIGDFCRQAIQLKNEIFTSAIQS